MVEHSRLEGLDRSSTTPLIIWDYSITLFWFINCGRAAVKLAFLKISVETQLTEHLKRTCCFISVSSTSESITV